MMLPPTPRHAVIIGAGPAGLTAAYELMKRGSRPLVLEKSDQIGGIARTECRDGYRYDIGGHRFFTKVTEVEDLWREVLGEEFIKVDRLSRIFYQGRYYSYPLELKNTLRNLGPWESFMILMSFFKWKLRPYPEEETFEQWVTNRFGGRLYTKFFRTYTEKVWGIPCNEIRADWAAQRIKGLSLTKAVINALIGTNDTKTLIKQFDYPALGPGQMWERFRDLIEEGGGEVRMNSDIVGVRRDGDAIASIVAREGDRTVEYSGAHYLSTMPLAELILQLDPPPPPEVLAAARGLSYRDFLIVGLVVRGEGLFPDNWIYIHDPGAKVGRIQNFGNWSPAMVPEPGKTSLGMEYFCSVGDAIWETPDDELVELARRDLALLKLARPEDVERGVVIRQPKAYPVYDAEYRRHLEVLRGYLGTLRNFQTIGRNGMHRYNNQDHSMLTAILAVRNLFGERHDLWDVNTERSYHEDFVARGDGRGAGGVLADGDRSQDRDRDLATQATGV